MLGAEQQAIVGLSKNVGVLTTAYIFVCQQATENTSSSCKHINNGCSAVGL